MCSGCIKIPLKAAKKLTDMKERSLCVMIFYVQKRYKGMLVTTVKPNEYKRALLLPDAAQSSLLSV